MTQIPLNSDNRMLRIGFGKHDGHWFFRIVCGDGFRFTRSS